MGRYDYVDYVSLTMEFRCNLRCVHCMIEGTMDRLEEEPRETLDRILIENARDRKWSGLILTGSEITLNKELPELARAARNNGFDHVRIQTHGMRLAQESYLAELIDAGVDEFFVSVAGCDAASHDAITEVPGSFEKTVHGLENLEKHPGVTSITNSVVTAESYQLLPRIVQALEHLKRLSQMEFWIYWPMNEDDVKGLIPNHLTILPHLMKAIDMARSRGREVEVKNYPECLLGSERRALDNSQPQLFIDPDFWKEFEKNGFFQCVYMDECASRTCLGLNTAYIKKYGLHENELEPLPPLED